MPKWRTACSVVQHRIDPKNDWLENGNLRAMFMYLEDHQPSGFPN